MPPNHKKDPPKPTKAKLYRNGAEGFILWANENVCIPVYHEGSDIPMWTSMGELPDNKHSVTGRSYKDMWDGQKEIVRECLIMNNGRFQYKLIVLNWMRGEGKSFLVCLIQLWKFFCWPRQNIVLGANSKDQVKFVHFDVMSDIILNSPKLLRIVGQRNVQQKEIRIKDGKNRTVSIIRAISSFSGIVSNITGYTFSEMFAQKKSDFFTQLDGSIRNIPNALGCIDTTVSSKDHVLYQLYENKTKGKLGTEELYYSYRCSPRGVQEDFWNPHMTQQQLEGYRMKFPFGDFERYFMNSWTSAAGKVFSPEMIEAMRIVKVDGEMYKQKLVLELLKQRNKMMENATELDGRGLNLWADFNRKCKDIEDRFGLITDYYSMDTGYSSRMCEMEDLMKLGNLFDTDWAILAGLDRADPMKVTSDARTVLTVVAKGLPQSRSNPNVFYEQEGVPKYLYVLLFLKSVADHSLKGIKGLLTDVHSEYESIESLCGERWGLWDLQPWCEERDIKFEAVFPTYDRQRTAFSEVWESLQQGRFKAAPTGEPGFVRDDLLWEELEVFNHDTESRWFGSNEKYAKGGVQDDAIFSLGWCLFGGRELGMSDFRTRGFNANMFGIFESGGKLLGTY